jgi:flavin reductase (DIM6/NTAB) family NADH-FMN oxidoreductase RutF
MEIDAQGLTVQAAYKLLTGIIVPRPIAWISTLTTEGKVNLAPFSAFTFVSHDPPMVGISVGVRNGVMKDTARNILAHEEFVVNIADRALLQKLHESSFEYPPEVSEADELGLTSEPSVHIRTPRIAEAPVAMECRLHQCIEFGRQPSRLLVGEVLRFRFREGLLVNGKLTTTELDPVSRLGGPNYASLGDIVTLHGKAITPFG